MCGRFTLAVDDWTDVLTLFGVSNIDFSHKPRYNIAPTQDVVGVVSDGKGRRAGLLRWSLIPNWSESEHTSFKTFNARSETLLVKPAFKNLVERRRCLILADSFIEWHRHTKKPHRIRLKNREVFAFAGLYDIWRTPEGKKVSSCTIITCRPNGLMTQIHDRMPVILRRSAEDDWLDRSITETSHLMNLLQPYSDEDMYSYPISDMINNVKFDSPACVREDRGTTNSGRQVFHT